MKRIAVSVLALALTAATAGSAFAGAQDYGPGYDQRYDNSYNNGNGVVAAPRSDIAQVVRVEPVYDQYANSNNSRQECWNESTNSYDNGYYRDNSGRLFRGNATDSNANGTLLGALIGGALGTQVGKGDGRTAATIGGAVIGGAIGNTVDSRNQAGGYDQYRDNSGTVRRCRPVNSTSQSQGFNVTYRYAGQTYQSFTRYRPGRTMRVVVDVRPQDDNVAYRR